MNGCETVPAEQTRAMHSNGRNFVDVVIFNFKDLRDGVVGIFCERSIFKCNYGPLFITSRDRKSVRVF